jgi:serine/threonine protein phosphatase PrpC
MPPKTNNYAGLTDTGRMRENNEDAFIAEPVMNKRYIAACAIDGVGGYEGGEVAARIARESILDYLRIPSGEIVTMLREALSVANEKIIAEKSRNPQLDSMACVVTLALADTKKNKFFYAHVGDTRLYLFRDQTLVKITRDQSFVGFLEDSGRLTEEAAMAHPKRNEINKALGFDARISATPDYIESGESPFLPGDLLLLCSDGLTDLVDSSSITTVLRSPMTLAQKAQSLVDAANNEGGKDNITVVLVHNDTAPVQQVATKPAVVKKNSPQNQQEEQPVAAPPQKRSSGRKAVTILSLLCLLLLGGLLWMLYSVYGTKQPAEAVAVVVQPGEDEKSLSDAVSAAGDTLVLSGYGDTLTLTGPMLVGKDTLYIKGNGLVLKADSLLKAPGLIFSANTRKVLLDSVTFMGFDVAMSVQNKSVRLKGVRFVNCRIPVQAAFPVPGNSYVSGLAGDTTFRIDSLPKIRTNE